MYGGIFMMAGGSRTVPTGLPSADYYQRFVGCIDYLRLGAAAAAAGQARKQRVHLVADRDAHDTLAFCGDDPTPS